MLALSSDAECEADYTLKSYRIASNKKFFILGFRNDKAASWFNSSLFLYKLAGNLKSNIKRKIPFLVYRQDSQRIINLKRILNECLQTNKISRFQVNDFGAKIVFKDIDDHEKTLSLEEPYAELYSHILKNDGSVSLNCKNWERLYETAASKIFVKNKILWYSYSNRKWEYINRTSNKNKRQGKNDKNEKNKKGKMDLGK